MNQTAYDPTMYKETQQREWDAVAAGWKKWWEWFELRAQHVSNRLIEIGNVQPGQNVLDVATGIGEPALTAAYKVGPEGHVIATDQAAGMLEIAGERKASLRLENLEFKHMDAEALDFPDESFDTVLCRGGSCSCRTWKALWGRSGGCSGQGADSPPPYGACPRRHQASAWRWE